MNLRLFKYKLHRCCHRKELEPVKDTQETNRKNLLEEKRFQETHRDTEQGLRTDSSAVVLEVVMAT